MSFRELARRGLVAHTAMGSFAFDGTPKDPCRGRYLEVSPVNHVNFLGNRLIRMQEISSSIA